MFYVICGGVILATGLVTAFGLIAAVALKDPHEQAVHRPHTRTSRA